MTYSYFDTFDEKLKNIIEIGSKHYDEACILIFVYLDFLSNFVEKPHSSNNARFNGSNIRYFLLHCSHFQDTLKYIQVDKFINDFSKGRISKDEYQKYYDKIERKLERVKNGVELPISSFISLENVDSEHKEYFQKITLFNLIYSLRNSAVHGYNNLIEAGSELSEPFLSYTWNIEEGNEGWFTTYIPFDFMYRMVDNCYSKVREEYGSLVERFFEEYTDIT
ncbi:hypothetical protein AK95_16370 [Paenibacillus sp. LC231]|uniref:hypothetical protein n=1 Tax=Paenibacillus sp. LC231 TaxID=1120679 RepID=UPI0008DD119E|nr:hypothetical protein [Paenibacillus sp. LC231]OIA98733.1 hypothetical protein AK95_16370 [Paenibacillus sp. LC231]